MQKQKLFPPDPEITLYQTGFGGDDPFDRKGTGKALSDLVERIEDPLVIALDGGWGSGKTWFLKRWVGAHRKENGSRATTVYFDAFAHDFMDEPLIGLTAAIGECPSKDGGGGWDKARKAAAKLVIPAARVALAALTAGVSEAVGAVAGAAVGAIGKEIETAADAFWAQEDGRREAMKQFRDALVELTTTGGEDGKPAPLVVVVDELDRCRPDYALALLEVIKHFFSVPNVHFVLGVNLDALGHSVRARYGAGIDAERYLRKFISLSMHLPDQMNDHKASPLVLAYFKKTAKDMGIVPVAIGTFGSHLDLATRTHMPTMRDMNQLLSRLALVDSEAFIGSLFGWRDILTSMILFQHSAPQLARKTLDGTLTLQEVHTFYGISPEMLNKEDGKSYDRSAYIISGLWKYVITDGVGSEQDRDEFSGAFDDFRRFDHPRTIPGIISRKYLEKFVFQEPKP
ncbi:MAG: KAP family NTPase [Gemmobacter sp.]|nr:KAP family NTPase [Gemmobacter sp.]